MRRRLACLRKTQLARWELPRALALWVCLRSAESTPGTLYLQFSLGPGGYQLIYYFHESSLSHPSSRGRLQYDNGLRVCIFPLMYIYTRNVGVAQPPTTVPSHEAPRSYLVLAFRVHVRAYA